MQNMQEKLNKKANIIVHSFLFTDMQSSQGFFYVDLPLHHIIDTPNCVRKFVNACICQLI